MGCHNHLPVWALGPWKHRYSCSWDLHLNLLPFTWPCYTASHPTNKNQAYQQRQQRGPNWVEKETFLHVCIQHINWLLSFVPLLCPPTISVQAAVVTPRKKNIVVLNEIFMCGCLSIRVKQISTLFSSEWERDHVSDVTNYHWAPQSSFWIFTSNCYFGGTIGLNSLKRQWCQMCGVIKRSKITSHWAEKEALVSFPG